MRMPGAPRGRRLRLCVAATAVCLAVWVTTAGAGPLDLYGRPAALPALSATTLAVRYAANRRVIEQAMRTAERVHDHDRVRVFSAFLRPGRSFLFFDPRSTGRAV